MSTEDLDRSAEPLSASYSNRRSHQRVWLLSVALLGVGSFYPFQRQGAPQPRTGQPSGEPPAIPITATTARTGEIGDYVSALGYVTPVQTVTVRSRVDGELLRVHYREGQMVRRGQILAEIDPRPFQAQLTQAEGQYQRDKALLDQARIDLARYREAYARNAIPAQQVDIQRATVYQYEGILKLDQGQVESARVNLLYATIRAPITGRAGLRLVDAGNIVQAGDPNGLLVITQIQPITVIFSIAADYLPRIQGPLRRGRRLTVDALDRAQQKVLGSGSVFAMDNQIDATTGTIRLRALFQNRNQELFPNQFVNARLLIGVERGATLIPPAAIQRSGEAAFVYLVKPDRTATIRNITVGISNDKDAAVQGIAPGDIVATDGFDKLQDGAKVTIQQEAGNSSQGARQRQ
jgi:membrane fusion protein, multidrug efflux system